MLDLPDIKANKKTKIFQKGVENVFISVFTA